MKRDTMIKTMITFSTLIILMFSGCSRQDEKKDKERPPATVELMRVQPQSVESPMEFTATTSASRPVQIRARVEGYLQSRNYREGSYVKAGDVLFKIDPKPFAVAVSAAEAALAAESAKKENTAQNLKRTRALAEQKASGQQELENAIAADRTQSALVDAAKAALAQAKLNLGYTVITAPVSGWADKVTQYEGSYISPAQNGLLTTVYQSNPLYAEFSVGEHEMQALHRSMKSQKNQAIYAEVLLSDGTRYSRKGKIVFLSPAVDTQTGTRTARAEFANPEGELLPGQFVKVQIRGLKYSAFVIPQKALMQGPKGSFVYVVGADGSAQVRPVKVGEWVGENVVISEGLREGESIVSEGNARVEPGKAVKIASPKH